MKKILFLGLLVLSLFGAYKLISLSNNSTDVKNFIIVKTRFKDNPRIFTDNFVNTALYKNGENGEKIDGITLFSNTIFQVDKGDYTLKSDFEGQHFKKNVQKIANTPKTVTLNFAMNNKIRFFELFNRTSVFILLFIRSRSHSRCSVS